MSKFKVIGTIPTDLCSISPIFTSLKCPFGCEMIVKRTCESDENMRNDNVDTLFTTFHKNYIRVARCRNCGGVVDIQVSVPQSTPFGRVKKAKRFMVKTFVTPFLKYSILEE